MEIIMAGRRRGKKSRSRCRKVGRGKVVEKRTRGEREGLKWMRGEEGGG